VEGLRKNRMDEEQRMRIVILGSGTAMPMADRAAPGLVLFAEDDPLLFDFGPSVPNRLVKAGILHTAIKQIFLTHFHPDHTAGLSHFLFATRNPGILPHRHPFTLAGPSGLTAFVTNLQAAYGGYLDLPADIMKLVEFDPDGTAPCDFPDSRISYCRTPHTENSVAYRIEDHSGRRVVYAGDTAFSEEVVQLAQSADLLILEASFPDGHEVPGHLTPSAAGRMATLAGAKRLLLTHFYPECLRTDIAAQCRKTYQGELILARDLLTIHL
jgi:ribonuclease BN (tRNA processing enzyme)